MDDVVMFGLHGQLRTTLCQLQTKMEEMAVRHIGPDEETITDLLLYELADPSIPNCFIYKFNKQQEGKNGSDYSLQLVSQQGDVRVRLPFLVQAKRMFPSGKYESLHKSSKQRPQTSHLIRAADKQGVVPLFAFYNAAPSPRPGWAQPVLISQCPLIKTSCTHSAPPDRDEADVAVTVAAAREVDGLVDSVGASPSIADLSPISWPLPCLAHCFCLEDALADELPDGDGGRDYPSLSLVERAVALLQVMDEDVELARASVPTWLNLIIDAGGDVLGQSLLRQPELADVDALVVLTDVSVV